ncbi:MAG: polysaccharide deacetylase family protein [Dysgonomonas sp.]|nr:polysaccharide deacetylase family protein [Dysgonomonas sp.]
MNIITFDIEEWLFYEAQSQYSVDSLLNNILDVLDKKKVKGTFFCLGYLAREYKNVIKLIHSRGHEIACHSDMHRWIIEMTPEEFSYDTKIAIQSLEDLLGEKVVGYRAPAFSITEKTLWALEILSEYGIEYDSSIFPAARSFGGFPSFTSIEPCTIVYKNIRLKEFPIPITTIFNKKIAYSGGGYFRLLPYSKISQIMCKSRYSMTYFHLRDFDTVQKKELNLRYFKSYYGIKGAYKKWLQMMDDFEFINIQTASQMIDWDKNTIIL